MKKLLLTLCLVWLANSTSLRAEVLRGLTSDNQLISFDSANPLAVNSVAITGLIAGDTLISMDQRPANGLLYGFATNGVFGRLYNIDKTSGMASLSSTLSVSPTGNFFDIDFNPTVDRLRVVSDTGQNLRVNVTTGATIVDGALQFAAGDLNAGTPAAVTAAAYTNSVGNATSTTLYGLELNTNGLVLQSPPNAGVLSSIGSLSGVLFPQAAFDISGTSGIAYAVLNGFELSQVDLATGNTTSLGIIGATGMLSVSLHPLQFPNREPVDYC